VRGDIKVFDFGLSTEMFSHLKDENDLYHLTGYVGTLRYMAPEVFFGLPYSTSADVFSFGTVFWQMCALELPFANLSMKMYEKKVMEKELIPRKIRWWPGNKEIYNIMKSCWKRDPLARPLMSEICKTISLKIAQRSGENATDVQFRLESRRSRGSVLSFHPNTSRGSDMSSSSYSSFLSMRISKRNFDNTK
jgi:serine/threonine protein kinase